MKITDNGTVLTLGLVGLVAAAGVARAGWKGEWSGGLQTPFGGLKGGAGAQLRFGRGSVNQVGDILDAYGYTGKTRAKWKKKLDGLSQSELDYVHGQVVG